MTSFLARQAIERIRSGLVDSVAVDRLTIEDPSLLKQFSHGLRKLDRGDPTYLCICGSYGQGKSHTLGYLQKCAKAEGYASSIVQLDFRELPFHQFHLVFQSILRNLLMPTGDTLFHAWKKYASQTDKESFSSLLETIPEQLRALLHEPFFALTAGGLKHRRIKLYSDRSQNVNLEEAKVPRSSKSHFQTSRSITTPTFGITDRKNSTYLQMVYGLGTVLHAMGLRGLVLLFDEAESIVQLRLKGRLKSYEILNHFFEDFISPMEEMHRASRRVYPLFAFTETFFDKVRSEKYHSEPSPFPQNYGEKWSQISSVRLQDDHACWDEMQNRLIALYEKAYQIDLSVSHQDIKRRLQSIVDTMETQEMRYKIKAFIHQLDIFCNRKAS